MSGKIDLAVADQYLAKYEMHQFMGENANKFKFLEHSLAKRGLRIAVSKKNKEGAQLIKSFNQTLAQMQNDDSLNTLIAQYKDSLIRKLNYQPKKDF